MRYLILIGCFAVFLSGCQSFAADHSSVTLAAEMTGFATESSMIQQTALVEQTAVVATLQSAGTLVADAASVNLVLAETVRANVISTPSVREVIVNPGDMGSSLDTEMMEDDEGIEAFVDMQVNNLGIARSVNNSNGCSNGVATQFTDADERVYFTSQVINLENGTNFSVDWVFEDRIVYRSVWTSDYSASSECIWFFMTPDDAAFLPGVYTVTLYVNGNALPSQQFSISIG